MRLLLLDPSGLGKNVAGFLPLSDPSLRIVTAGAWYQSQDIEKRLEEVSAHIASVTQRALRTKYKTIEEFNAVIGENSEPYWILLVINFPHNFTERASRELASIFTNGPRCGVLCVTVVDTSIALPYGFDLAQLRSNATLISARRDAFVWHDSDFESATLRLDGPPEAGVFEAIVQSVAHKAEQADSVRVPFSSVGVPRNDWWKSSSKDEIKVGLGRTAARDVLYLSLGKALAQNVLIAGRPGSGKSTLLHVLIANLVAAYSVDELILYLVDFKEGVEFKQYANCGVPQVRVVAVHSDREFGLSVLQELHHEFERRGAEYRSVGGGATVAEFRSKTSTKMPRILLLVDEFQKFFVEDDQIAADAGLLIDILIRQGRAFGIHLLLSSQTLAGAFSLPKATLDLATVRIALQCSDADSRLILGEDNPAASQLSRPGEGVYNDSNGAVASNVLFQVAWLAGEQRAQHLKLVADLSEADRQGPVVFDGDELVRLENNIQFRDLVGDEGFPNSRLTRQAWLGEPVTIKAPTAARFLRQEGRHLAVVGRDERAATGILVSVLVGLAAQYPSGKVRFLVADLSAEDSALSLALSGLSTSFSGRFTVIRERAIRSLLDSAIDHMNAPNPASKGSSGALYLVVFGLHRIQDLGRGGRSHLKWDESGHSDATTEDLLMRVLRSGPESGIHLICWSDAVASMIRCLERQGIAEFGMRVALPMSDRESEDLLDSPAASRLGNGRALLFDDLDPNHLERFRPYEIPSNTWVAEIGQRIAKKRGDDCA
jgi:energy-coupling factor transporter ATP-binding protein EcfA2